MPHCYMCKAPSTGKEHVPPKCFFPKPSALQNWRLNLITVKSCDEHNSEKSKDDEFALMVFLATVKDGGALESLATTKFAKVLNHNPSIKKEFQNLRKELSRDPKTGLYMWQSTGEINYERFLNYFDQSARALLFWHYDRSFQGRITMHPDFLWYMKKSMESMDAFIAEKVSMLEFLFRNERWYGKNGEIFKYQVLWQGQHRHLLMRMCLFSSSNVWVQFNDLDSVPKMKSRAEQKG